VQTAVAIVSDICLYREGLELVLQRDGRTLVVGTASSREAAMALLAEKRPQVVLIDMAMRNAVDSARRLSHALPAIRVVALALEEVETQIIACAEAGVVGYVTRDGTVNDVVDAVEAASRAELRCSPRVAAYLMERVRALSVRGRPGDALDQLTARQRHVLRLVAEGLSNKEIAETLHIELATVKNHVHNILDKLQVQRRGEATVLWRRSVSENAYGARS
jgi:RNA polymerase sigma factor (sigma-70 family)